MACSTSATAGIRSLAVQDAKIYLTRTFFSISADTWEGLEPKVKAKLLGHEVWDPANEKKVREMQREHARRMHSMDDFDPDR